MLKRASKLQIRIEDPNHYLSPRSSLLEPPPQIVIGVRPLAGTNYPAKLASTDRTGRTYQVPVAFDIPLTVTLSTKRLIINDDRGIRLANGVANLTFQHVSGAPSQKSFTFTVTGRTN